jgi:hypothetical protein
MKLLQNIWVRIVISLLGGGMTTEIVFLSTGDPTRHRSANDPNFTLIYALIIYLVLTWVAKKFGPPKPLKPF